MKAFKIILMTLVVLILTLAIGRFVFLKTFNINQYREQITKEISKAIGRDVSIDNLALNFVAGQGILIDATGLSVSDDPEFSDKPFLTLESLRFDLDIMAFLKTNQISATRVEIHEPHIDIIRNKAGEINLQRLMDYINKIKDTAETKSACQPQPNSFILPLSVSSAEASSAPAIPYLLIKSIRIIDGEVGFTDNFFTPAIVIPIESLNFQISNFSLTKPFKYQLACSLWSDMENIRLNGQVRLDIPNGQARLDDVQLKTDLSNFSLDKIKKDVFWLAAVPLESGWQGLLNVNISQAIVGAQGLIAMACDVKFEKGKVKVAGLPAMGNINLNLGISESNIDIKDSSLDLASGKVTILGKIEDYLKTQKFLMNMNMVDLDLGELLAGQPIPAKIEGKVIGQYQVQGQGFTPEAITKTLAGTGNMEVKEGKISGVNILKLVLGRTSIPILGDLASMAVPEQYKNTFLMNDTVIEKAQLAMKILDGAIMIENGDVDTKGFHLNASGKVNFDQTAELEFKFYIPEELSAKMVESNPDLAGLMDQNKRISFPMLPFHGKLTEFKLMPNIDELLKRGAAGAIQNQLLKIFKIENPSSENSSAGNGQQQGQPPGNQPNNQREDMKPEQIIGNILRTILDKNSQ